MQRRVLLTAPLKLASDRKRRVLLTAPLRLASDRKRELLLKKAPAPAAVNAFEMPALVKA